MKPFAAKLLLNVCIAFVVVPLLTASAQNTEEDCDAPAKTMDAFSQKLLDAAKESPVLVAKHDKKRWLSLFAEDGLIQDPVGAPGHYNHGGFYDTFIKENDIRFKENGDWVDKDRLTVYRDVDIYIGFGNDWGMMVQPAILMYVFDEDLKVKNLKAHWNMLWSYPHLDESPVLDFAKYGVGASRNFVRVFTNHGASFGYKYVKGLLAGYFSGGAACARQLAKAIRTNKNKAVTKLFESGSSVIELPGNVVATPATLLDELASSSVSKIHVSKVYESGYTTACRIDVHAGKEVKQGVALFGISDKKISNLTMYWD